MFSLGSQHQYFLYRESCDMRKGFDGLSGLVSNELGRSPTDGSVFVFIKKPRNQMKLLHWERGGLVLYQKRLETGRFSLPEKTEKDYNLSWPELVLIVEGISYVGLKKKKRYE
jgi:transposase